MRDNARVMVLASFAADSLALGVHWVYDPARLVSEYGRVEAFLKPKENSYHSSKNRGEFTHYGDQEFVLLESVVAKSGFDLNDFSQRWQDMFRGYRGYIDGATKGTLKNFEKGKGPQDSGSPSNDLAGASRIAPLVYYYREDLAGLVEAARAQTKMTHADSLTVDSAEFLARVAWGGLRGISPVEAITEITQERFADSPIADWVDEGLRTQDMESVTAIGDFGRSCHTPDAFPGVIHLISKYENDLREAVIQAVMAGGDNAARAMPVSMVLGAYLGKGSLPDQWLKELKKGEEISNLLEQIG
jgi:ADP-ribosylglycohydrolase